MTKRFLSKVGKSLTRACAVTLPKNTKMKGHHLNSQNPRWKLGSECCDTRGGEVTEQVRAKVENGSNQNQHRRIRRHPVGSGYKFRIILQHRHIKMYRQRKTHHAEGDIDKTPGLTDMAKELRLSQELPLSSDMERRTATRLSVMERSQAETNKKLESLHNLMQTVLTTVSLVKLGEDVTGDRISTLSVRETVGNKDEGRAGTEALHRGEGSSKHCWDKLTKHSDDDVKEFEVHVF